jgi:hypothetical protein
MHYAGAPPSFVRSFFADQCGAHEQKSRSQFLAYRIVGDHQKKESRPRCFKLSTLPNVSDTQHWFSETYIWCGASLDAGHSRVFLASVSRSLAESAYRPGTVGTSRPHAQLYNPHTSLSQMSAYNHRQYSEPEGRKAPELTR